MGISRLVPDQMQGKSQILDRVEDPGEVKDQSRLCVRA